MPHPQAKDDFFVVFLGKELLLEKNLFSVNCNLVLK